MRTDSWIIQVSPKCNDECPCQKGTGGDLREEEEAVWPRKQGRSDVATSSGTPGATCSWKRQGWIFPPPKGFAGAQPLMTASFWTPGFQNWERIYFSVVLSPPAVVICYGSSEKLIRRVETMLKDTQVLKVSDRIWTHGFDSRACCVAHLTCELTCKTTVVPNPQALIWVWTRLWMETDAGQCQTQNHSGRCSPLY